MKICWQLEALAKKKRTHTTFKAMLLLSTHFSHLKALALVHSWQVRRTCPGRRSCVVSLQPNNPLFSVLKGIKCLLLQGPDVKQQAQRKGLSTPIVKAANMNFSGTKAAFMRKVPCLGEALRKLPPAVLAGSVPVSKSPGRGLTVWSHAEA